VSKSLSKRTHVILPVDVVAGIDKLTGKRGRSAFIAEVVRREIKILQQRDALRAAKGAWKEKDHPELAQGAAAWVRQIRVADTKRFLELERRRGSR
jgi:Arc/MetJ-type ribon-helix-helix transcriptional regulator